jgi:hypothetical protein
VFFFILQTPGSGNWFMPGLFFGPGELYFPAAARALIFYTGKAWFLCDICMHFPTFAVLNFVHHGQSMSGNR